MLGESSSTVVNVCVRSLGLSACRVIRLRPAMYVAGSYRAPDPEAAVEIIAVNPWAVLVSCTDVAPLASHIPVVLDCEAEPGATLLGHPARANPHSRLLSQRGRFSKPMLVTIGPELGRSRRDQLRLHPIRSS
jgi:hypothetical protein